MQTPDYPALPEHADIHYMVEDQLSTLPKYIRLGYSIAIEPFPTESGMCAVLQDEQGTRIGILERPIETNRSIRH